MLVFFVSKISKILSIYDDLWADLIINPVLQLGKLVSLMALFESSNPEELKLLTHPSDTKIIRFLIIFYSLFGLLDLDDKKLV